MSIKSKFYKLRRMAIPKRLPPFVYRMDDRPEAFVRANGLQPKGLRTDGAPGQFGPPDLTLSVIEHVRKTSDTTNAAIGNVDPWISFFAWHALQPISAAVGAFMHGYVNGKIYRVDTGIATANGYNFFYANEQFDLAERRSQAAQYRGQREWTGWGTTPIASITSFVSVPVLIASLNNNTAPDPSTLIWTPM